MIYSFFIALFLTIIGFLSIGQDFILVQFACAVCLFLFNLKTFKKTFVSNKGLNWFLLFFCLSICLSSFWGYYGLHHVFDSLGALVFHPARGCLYAFILFQYYITIENLISTQRLDRVLNFLALFIFIILLVQDIDIFMNPVSEETFEPYLLGDKFTIVYLHLFFAAIVSKQKLSINLPFIIIICFLTFIISQKTFCSTGKVLSIAFVFLILFKKSLSKLISSRALIIIEITLAILFAFFSTFILEISSIEHFITETLGEDYTVAGRIRIYEVLALVILQSPWIGYGFNNSSFIVSSYIGFGNAQNGFLDNVVNYGIVGTLFIVFILLYCAQSANKEKIDGRKYMFLVVIHLLLLASTIEVTINTLFLCILPLLLSPNIYENEKL